MAKVKDRKEHIETGFNFEELGELIIGELGGMAEAAKLFTEGVKTAESLYVKQQCVVTLTRLLKQAMPQQKATDGLTDEEIDEALHAEIMRMFVSMDEEEYRATIKQIEKARAGESQGPGEGPEENRQDVPADNPSGDDGRTGASSEQHPQHVPATPASAEDWAASFDRPIDGSEQ